MNRYETIFIFDPDIGGDDQEAILEKLRLMIPQGNGTLLMFDDWGDRKFAYEIKKKMHGRYVRLDYCGGGNLVDDIERFFRLDYRILKFMTILLDKDVDVETLKLEMEEPQDQVETDQAGDADAAAAGDAEDAESAGGPEAEEEEETAHAGTGEEE
jgi:small subunit ribosomal protein S6